MTKIRYVIFTTYYLGVYKIILKLDYNESYTMFTCF